MQIEGGCFCRAIRFSADVDPATVSVCHCTDCQRLTGSPYRVTAILPGTSKPHIVSGTPRRFAKSAESHSVQHFCGDCGSPLFFSNTRDGSWGIRWGAIDQRAQLAPQRAIWRRSAVSWNGAIDDLPGRSGD